MMTAAAVLALMVCSLCFAAGWWAGIQHGRRVAARCVEATNELYAERNLTWKDRDMLPSMRAQVESQEAVIQDLRDENNRAKALAREIIQPGTHNVVVRFPGEAEERSR